MIKYCKNFVFILIISCNLHSGLVFGKDNGSLAGEIVRFKDVHRKAGIKSTGDLAHSATWVDVNSDGCQDLIASNTSLRRPPRSYLFLNKCDGTFLNIPSKESGLEDFWFIRSINAADYDNDGNVDLVFGGIDTKGFPFLFNNTGDGKFIDVSDISNLSGQGYFTSLTWADYDNDGWVDLFQGGKRKHLYKNMKNGSFEDTILESGIIDLTHNLSSLWFDYNNDKYLDIFLSNNGFNSLYRNNGDGTFVDISAESNVKGEESWKSSAACTGDFDNDGYFDLYLVNISSKRNALYKNNGDGTFTDITDTTNTGDVGDGRTCSFVDYNSDGWMDIYTTNHIRPSKLYRNNRDGTFTNMSFKLGVHMPIDAFSVTWGDFNGDTKPDVFLNGHIDIALYRGLNLNNSIVIELIGDGINTNKSAIGSRVIVTSASTKQTREVSGGKGCCENDMLPIHIGLGEDEQFDVVVEWTNSDKCSFSNLNVNNALFYKINQKNCDLFSY